MTDADVHPEVLSEIVRRIQRDLPQASNPSISTKTVDDNLTIVVTTTNVLSDDDEEEVGDIIGEVFEELADHLVPVGGLKSECITAH